MKLKLGIKDKHIFEGERANPQNCAIARALKDKIRNITKVGVFPENVYLVVKKNKKETLAYKGDLTKTAAAFIKRFDEGKPVYGFNLNLTLKPVNTYIKQLA